MPGETQTKNSIDHEEEEKNAKPYKELDEGDIQLLKTYGMGPYTLGIKELEDDIKKQQEKIKELIGIKESDTGLSPPSQWDLQGDDLSPDEKDKDVMRLVSQKDVPNYMKQIKKNHKK